MGKRLKLEDWKSECTKIHNGFYDYSKVSYETVRDKVEIICPTHGSFWQDAYSHKRGCGCKKCVDNSWVRLGFDYFIEKATSKYGNKFDYSDVTMNSMGDVISIICPDHGVFKTTGTRHLEMKHGCPKCGNVAGGNLIRLTTGEFIEKARIIHGDKFDYSKSIYTNRINKIIITCPIHGDFETTPDVHLKPYACDCPMCSVSGWDRTSWVKICRKNKNSIPCVYIVRCYNDSESFYKIGRTMRSIKNRFLRPSVMPYKYELIKQIISTPIEIYDLEVNLHRLNAEFRYVPKITFPGSTECFSNFKLTDEYIN